MIFQRTATPPLTSCLSPRVHSTNAVPCSRPHPRLVMSTAASSQWHVCHSKLSHVVGSPQLLVHIACVKTVSEPLELEVMGICFERKADSPSCCFFEKVVRKRRANRPGYCAPKSRCATRLRYAPTLHCEKVLPIISEDRGRLVWTPRLHGHSPIARGRARDAPQAWSGIQNKAGIQTKVRQ